MTRKEKQADTAAVQSDDIVFACPHCGESLAVDRRAAGMEVTCPKCGGNITVPAADAQDAPVAGRTLKSIAFDPRDERIRELASALDAARSKIAELTESIEETNRRRVHLEELRVSHNRILENIRRETDAIRESLERIADILKATGSGGEEHPPAARS